MQPVTRERCVPIIKRGHSLTTWGHSSTKKEYPKHGEVCPHATRNSREVCPYNQKGTFPNVKGMPVTPEGVCPLTLIKEESQ